MATGESGESPDVAGNPLIQNMKVALSAAESKFADISQRLDKNHPQYQSAKAEVDQLRNDLKAQTKATSNTVGNNAQILTQREAAIRAALLEQKNKVLALNRTRDELNVLQKDVENAQRAFDATSVRLSQTRIEGQSEQSDIALLNPAVAPVKPFGPKILLNTALAIVLGTMLGVGLGFLMEMFDRRVRSHSDLSDILEIPVLGIIDWTQTKRRQSRFKGLFLRRSNLRLN